MRVWSKITRLCFYVLLAMISVATYAIPARKTIVSLPLVDGNNIDAVLCGDEFLHYYTTLEGKILVKDSSGRYRLATEVEEQGMLERGNAKRQVFNEMKAKSALSQETSTMITKAKTEEKRGLVLLVNFADVKMQSTNSRDDYDDMFNKKGYDYNGHQGSVSDYFYDQSNGALSLHFDVYGPYEVSKNLSYYGENSDSEADERVVEMVKEVINLADADVNYRLYDWDGDREVECVYIIYAGGSEASGAPDYTIWPHNWNIWSATGKITLKDGVRISEYACSAELYDHNKDIRDCIGSVVHEFSHILGMPDFYDTLEGQSYGMQEWSIMHYGCYNGPSNYAGCVPAAYTAYEKMYLGWLTPTELNSPCDVEGMRSIEQSDDAYIIYNDACKDEYYILQNVQKDGWNKYALGTGLLVLHVDYNQQAWYENLINTDVDHMRLTVIPADNNYNIFYDGVGGDVYPGTSGNHALTDESIPCASLFNPNKDNRNFMGKSIENITESDDGLISFTFMGGNGYNHISETAVDEWSGSSLADGVSYNIYGQKLNRPERGINIVGRKKVLIK